MFCIVILIAKNGDFWLFDRCVGHLPLQVWFGNPAWFKLHNCMCFCNLVRI